MSSILKFLQEMDKQLEQEEKPMGETVMTFGRHKGKTYDYIYDNDKQYVKWVITSKDSEKYVKKIKAYFTERIQQDYAGE
jgi:hypothetical protein